MTVWIWWALLMAGSGAFIGLAAASGKRGKAGQVYVFALIAVLLGHVAGLWQGAQILLERMQ